MGNGRVGNGQSKARGIKEMPPVGDKSKQLDYITSKEFVKSLIEIGTQEKPVTRHHLMYATGLSDRKNRKIIEDLRGEGMRICSSSHGKGYWLARSETEYKDFRAEYIAGATKRMNTVKRMDMAVNGQVGMED